MNTERQIYKNEYISETVINHDIREYRLQPKIADGYIRAVSVLDGIELQFYDFKPNKLIFENESSELNSFVIIYCIQGGVDISFTDESSVVTISQGDLALYHCKNRPVFIKYDTSQNYIGISVVFNMPEAKHSIMKLIDEQALGFQSYVDDCETCNCSVVKPDQHIINIFKDMDACPVRAQKDFFRLKVLELLLICIDDHARANHEMTSFFTENEIKKIKMAKDVLIKNYKAVPDPTNLSNTVGLSLKKLKRGFKCVYDDTLYSYHKKCKLEAAKRMLVQTDDKIISIANMVGYTNPSKFSEAFRAQYGITPIEYRKQNRI